MGKIECDCFGGSCNWREIYKEMHEWLEIRIVVCVLCIVIYFVISFVCFAVCVGYVFICGMILWIGDRIFL